MNVNETNYKGYSAIINNEKDVTKHEVASAVKNAEGETAKASEAAAQQRPKTDEVVISSQKQTMQKTAAQLKESFEKQKEAFIQDLKSMIVGQGQKSNLTLFGQKLYVSPEQSRKAQASIDDGGPFSVDATATRIFDMAKALSGGDKSKLSTLKTAVQKGFRAASDALGGSLPDISQKTYTEVMKRFDDWENEGNANTDVNA